MQLKNGKEYDMAVETKLDALAEQFKTLLETVAPDGGLIKNITGSVTASLSDEASKTRAKAPSVLQLFQPHIFDGSLALDGEEWLKKFDLYSKQAKYEGDAQLPLAVCFLRDKALHWYEALPNDSNEKTKYADFCTAFKAKFAPKSLTYAEKQELLLRSQNVDEDIEVYIYDLTKRFTRCDTPEAEQLHIFLKGLLPEMRRKLLEKHIQTFKEACLEAINLQKVNKIAKVYEETNTTEANKKSSASADYNESILTLKKVLTTLAKKADAAPQRVSRVRGHANETKSRAAARPVRTIQQNPAGQPQSRQGMPYRYSNASCFFCGIRGHLKNECRKRQVYLASMTPRSSYRPSPGHNRHPGRDMRDNRGPTSYRPATYAEVTRHNGQQPPVSGGTRTQAGRN